MTGQQTAGAPVYAVYNAPEDLLERLASACISADDVLTFLKGECDALLKDYTRTGASVSPPDINNFFSEPDLNIYRDALSWWPRVEGLPASLAAPSIYQLLWRYHDHTFGRTFVERLTKRAEAAQAWLVANQYDAAQPNRVETSDERRKRLNAEAQARHRARHGKGAGKETAGAVASAYRRYLDVCRERKDAHAAVDAEWGPRIHAAKAEWEALRKTGSTDVKEGGCSVDP